MKSFSVIGLMSGTSLDGLDIAHVNFVEVNNEWKFQILQAETINYSAEWKNKLKNAYELSASDLRKLDVDLGHYFGKLTREFIQKNSLKPLLVASHGHTVFHNPKQGYTLQIGDGPSLKTHINCSLVYDFRSFDVALGGQGAPLVPIGDQLLFSEFDACVNIGGFANISFSKFKKRIAFDICPANIVLNSFAEKLGSEFDAGGNWAKNGILNLSLLAKLNGNRFYEKSAPKSLGREWVEEEILPLLLEFSAEEILSTFTNHIADQVSKVLNANNFNQVLFTGGGVYNDYLMELIRQKTRTKCVIPTKSVIQFKEALIFAFLGILRFQNKTNVLASVTGASRDSSSGSVLL